MRILLVLTCCVGLASFAGAARPEEAGNNQGKKKGGGGANAPQQQVATPQTGKKFKAGPGGGPHNTNAGSAVDAFHPQGKKSQNFQQQGTANYTGGNKAKKAKWKDGQTQTNAGVENPTTNAASTKFNKGKFQANATGGGKMKFQKKHFDLQTNQINKKYKTVNFNQNYKIAGAQKWKGQKYQVFVNYQPQWHDTWWWNSHHSHIVFVFGGWYYWDNYYWYPAWGYAPNSVYYYDGPIYASSPQDDPGQVVANVQAALQEQGYYQGEVDGVLGPQTRAALAEFQSAQGLEPTGAVDEPTLETLGMV